MSATRRHLLVTNDFPPKVGGIQSYLGELWRRLPRSSYHVLTTPYRGAAVYDRRHDLPVTRSEAPVLLPTEATLRLVRHTAARVGAELVLFDPALPVGALGPRLGLPYGVILHGAEVTVPARLPGTRQLLARVLRGASLVVTAGDYSTREAERIVGGRLPVAVIPPGVDPARFRPSDAADRAATRYTLGLSEYHEVVLSASRLVPRKGIDTVVEAAAQLAPDRPNLRVVVLGDGRDRGRLERLAERLDAPVEFLGRLPDEEVPAVYAAADVFAMLCRTRWGGLEQEGFGIVFLEAAASGVPQLAGRSGGSGEAVVDGVTGYVIDPPNDALAVAARLTELLDDPVRRRAMGNAARARAVERFGYDDLAIRLDQAIQQSFAAGYRC